MTDRALPSGEIANWIIELLRDTPLATDKRELSSLVRLPLCEQFAVAVLVKAEGAETVQGALDSMAEREGHTRGHWSAERSSRVTANLR